MSFLTTGPQDSVARVLFAHGSGAPMDAPFMNDFAAALSERGLQTVRFEFAFMTARRSGKGRPLPRAETVMGEFVAAVDAVPHDRPLFIGGKSMGGRVATMVGEELFRAGRIAGVYCLGYPFRPPDKPEKLRTAHLRDLTVPTLICHGTRDEFGTPDEIATYALSPAIRIHWLESAGHDFEPARGSGGRSGKQNLQSAADAVAEWINAIVA